MQQPLCHLYFLIVMEHLWSKHHDSLTSKLSALVRTANNVEQELKAATMEEEVVLMWVELQAVIQTLIQHLAVHLDPKGIHGISDYQVVLKDLNKLD